ncbi:YPO3983 family protein [Serratia sp. UGAL515B_01]|uniref:YPO3983 family protein n=1 Tax=Serratia sp. UGAL515B_01 TaxID=2986763 RepID=UPI002955A62C|nr:YPO3983 family protein [Serratia sp. UGAL515B_01]WON77650.1 DUF3289 family protein [Serratia sp. UGAL515B_01]
MSETTQSSVEALRFPCTVFRTQRRMDDYGADDMRCGDLSETQLKNDFKLNDVSSKVNPYTLTLAKQLKLRSYGYGFEADTDLKSKKITRQECANILFDEFRSLSKQVSFYGPYQKLIGKMIDHMQKGNGAPFRDILLNAALKEQILEDTSSDNSSRLLLKLIFDKNIDWKNKCYPAEKESAIRNAISFGRLPKFDRLKDRVNGLGITVHDIYAAHITIRSLQIDNDRYRAVVHYNVQDHFGLDDDDIRKFRNYSLLFRIWFVLQRFNQFAYKPFMTNMEATIEITGVRNDKQK